jgi:hypothetical protein
LELARFHEQGIAPAGGAPEQFAVYVARQIRRWREAAQLAKSTSHSDPRLDVTSRVGDPRI